MPGTPVHAALAAASSYSRPSGWYKCVQTASTLSGAPFAMNKVDSPCRTTMEIIAPLEVERNFVQFFAAPLSRRTGAIENRGVQRSLRMPV